MLGSCVGDRWVGARPVVVCLHWCEVLPLLQACCAAAACRMKTTTSSVPRCSLPCHKLSESAALASHLSICGKRREYAVSSVCMHAWRFLQAPAHNELPNAREAETPAQAACGSCFSACECIAAAAAAASLVNMPQTPAPEFGPFNCSCDLLHPATGWITRCS
jgi:hypothetical protein